MSDPISVPPGYRFLRNINDGGFGSVVEVEENSTGEHFAVKLVRCTSDKDRKRIEREVNRLRTFVHHHIVRLKEVVKMENMQAIVMELGEQSLAQVVKSHSECEVLIDRHIVYQVMVDISSALCFMHNDAGERTAHGDVKLENILIFGDGHAKLCDLGAAESEDVSSTRGVMSMQYVSPERIEDAKGRATGSSDVWALGIVLHFLLFGKSPFRSEHAAGLIREIGSFQPSQIGRSCGEDERDLLKRMLDPDCGSRLTSKQLAESSILRCLINTTGAGWKLSEMKSRETEKRFGDLEVALRSSETKVAELHNQLTKEQDQSNQLKQKLENDKKEKEELETERNELKRKMEEIEGMMQGAQPKAKDGKDEETKRTGRWFETFLPRRTEMQANRSRNGADSIEWFQADGYSRSGSVFTRTGGDYPTLLSFSFRKVVSRFTFTFRRITVSTFIGFATSFETEKVKYGWVSLTNLLGGAGWDVFEDERSAHQFWKDYSRGSACAAGKKGQRVVLEADGRDGKRTLRLSQDGETQPTFFSNIPVPFRFAIVLQGIDDSVSIESVVEFTGPTLVGGTSEIRMDE
ncbi:putative CBL-interacting protein kinase 17 [Blattamonas nauphoetae]|uniref:CBL-interacting protein kinase 17 n=1 Tax=Blattamonas nauphoetae TaxID=2049346 RepID=A0ABQ9Y766_9EUKA|nr:putative CBL-interacting protein kinase 17 [Blattamonas nauphoetae]